VRGIKSTVDINVFNGFESEYQNFLRWQLIR
jgi:lysozyme